MSDSGAWGYGKPGVIPLRPLNLSEILDGAVATMRRHPALIFGVSAVVAVIEAALSLGLTILLVRGMTRVPQPGPAATEREVLDYMYSLLGQTSVVLGVSLVVTVVVRTVLTGFMTVVVGKAVLGKPITFGDAMRELGPRLPALFGVTAIYTLMVTVGAMFFLVPGIWLFTLFGLASPALVLEQGTLGQALRRSRLLVQDSWWRVFGVLLVATLCAAVISFVIQLPFDLPMSIGDDALTQLADAPLAAQLLSGAGQVVAQTLVAPFFAGSVALLYIDQRMRKEGMDIQLARAAKVV